METNVPIYSHQRGRCVWVPNPQTLGSKRSRRSKSSGIMGPASMGSLRAYLGSGSNCGIPRLSSWEVTSRT